MGEKWLLLRMNLWLLTSRLGASLSFCQSAHRATIVRRVHDGDVLPETLGEERASQIPVMPDSGAGDVMPQQLLPAGPHLLIHQTVDVVVMNRLEGFEELMGAMKEVRLVIHRKRSKVFQADPPNTSHLGVIHEGVGNVADGGGGGILGGNFGDTSAAMDLHAEIKH